jgi:catechol 2,3-dioxygenase-like lactoylglutathione lyase family enzyme
MNTSPLSIRPFIGAKDFKLSANFYRHLGFEQVVLSDNMYLFKKETIAFYLQDAFVKDWIDNTMIFIEVADADQYWHSLDALQVTAKFPGTRLSTVKQFDWGKECYLHDPSGILWHFGEFNKK